MAKTKQETEEAVEQASPERFARAKVKFLKIAPRKVRPVIDAIRYKNPERAFAILLGSTKKAARMTEKLLKTAVANAKVLGMDETRLYISDVRADGGPTMKRLMERSMGRANRIIKRTTHLSMILKEGRKQYTEAQPPKAAEAQKEAPKKITAKEKQSGRKKKAVAAKG